ncbi:phosphonate ABC transporter, permease protein PhnE [Haloferax volcanii]|jgi:phosphonate transport system permease protein|uniref:phosphonate ABC transporter, permease protein PhnE n=1 Tax=Haloferax volcanii TaxID=2246 RepID=UPI00249CC638|nr:phosphonate ABC transporter, permease protein PhnE [Haloferax alexandrinus]
MSMDTADGPGSVDDQVWDRLDTIRQNKRLRWLKYLVGIGLVTIAFYGTYTTVGFSVTKLVAYWPEFSEALGEYFPTMSIFGFPVLDFGRYWEFVVAEDLFRLSIVTVSMAFTGTLLGLPGALIMGTLGSERVTPFPFNFLFRMTMSIIRAIPALVWALIFIPLGGVTAFTGTLAIAVDTMGYLGRLFTDELEEIDDGPVEGVRSTGADKDQTVYFGMLSQVIRQYIAWGMYIFELNVRIAITLGLIGAGGLGFVMNMQRQTFQYTNMMAAILVSVVLILTIEMASQRIRSHLREDEDTASFVEILKAFPDKTREALAR